jgi:glutamyl-tRNA synthetase
MDQVRTRIAPSPTGENLHIGNAYTAYLNYIYAKKHGGQFIIRIEDTDRSRLVAGSEKRILESLNWLGIAYDEGPDLGGPYAPYRQSERLPIYRDHAEQLIESGHAYYCFCTPSRLETMRQKQLAVKKPPMYDGACREISVEEAKKRVKSQEKHVIRLKVPKDGKTSFTDLIRGDISFENNVIDDQVLLKSDGFPTYHLGVVVDDHIMKISHIIRGEEWISSTPKHILLYQFFGWEIPQIAHLSVLRNPDRSKLSKRKNPVWASWYRDEGIFPEALKNYFATLAWAHPEGKDIFSEEEFREYFDLSRLQTTAPVFDFTKLKWMNGEYLRKTPAARLKTQIFDFFNQKYPEEMIEKILPLVSERIKTLKEFASLADFFFNRPEAMEKAVPSERREIIKKALTDCGWDHESLEKTLRKTAEEEGVKAKDLFMDLRILVTGKSVGPPLLESLEILGKNETLDRLK